MAEENKMFTDRPVSLNTKNNLLEIEEHGNGGKHNDKV